MLAKLLDFAATTTTTEETTATAEITATRGVRELKTKEGPHRIFSPAEFTVQQN